MSKCLLAPLTTYLPRASDFREDLLRMTSQDIWKFSTSMASRCCAISHPTSQLLVSATAGWKEALPNTSSTGHVLISGQCLLQFGSSVIQLQLACRVEPSRAAFEGKLVSKWSSKKLFCEHNCICIAQSSMLDQIVARSVYVLFFSDSNHCFEMEIRNCIGSNPLCYGGGKAVQGLLFEMKALCNCNFFCCKM